MGEFVVELRLPSPCGELKGPGEAGSSALTLPACQSREDRRKCLHERLKDDEVGDSIPVAQPAQLVTGSNMRGRQ